MANKEPVIITQSFIIDGLLPGLDEMLQAARIRLKRRSRLEKKRFRGSKYQLLKREAGKVVSVAIWGAQLQPMESACLSFHWVEPNRKRDPSNVIAGGQKVILDSLVNTGILPNDGWKQIRGLTDTWECDTINPRILVTLEGPLRKEKP